MAKPLRVAVAASGGRDSTAMLHCVSRLAGLAGVEVHALHVHHGLQPAADAWMAHVAAQCRRWGRDGQRIVFHGHRVLQRPAKGDSIEAWARRERYAALARMAHDADCPLVLLAQHRRDQAETVLLQALRGAGPAGLAAMPRMIEREGLTWARPWLDQPREAIEAYIRRWRLRPVEDPSNSDSGPARSRLRTQVWPPLLAAFPDAETTLGALARRAQEARLIVDEVAQADAAQVVDGQALSVAAWARLSAARQSNVLRHWLPGLLTAAVPESLLQRLLNELPAAQSGRWPAGAFELRLHAGRLQAVAVVAAAAVQAKARSINLSCPGRYALEPWSGTIDVDACAEGGVPAALLYGAELRPRQGGERFQADAGGLPRSLKKQYQAQGVAAWAREVPLVFAGGSLVFVPGLGVDARALLAAGSPRVALHWQP